MKKFTLLDAATIGVCLIPLVYVFVIYPTLPATVPLHYDGKGVPNDYGTKGTFALVIGFMQVVAIGTYLLMRNLKYIDPKKHAQYGEAVYNKLGFGVTLFVTALSIVIVYATKAGGIKIDKVLFPLLGLLFAFIGNMMNNIKPNYFAGIRTPWTLEDPETWKATHRLGARVWMIGGLIICISALLLPNGLSSELMPWAVGVMAVVPIAYSYIYYKRHHTAKN